MCAPGVLYYGWPKNYDGPAEFTDDVSDKLQFNTDSGLRFDPQQVAGFVVFNGCNQCYGCGARQSPEPSAKYRHGNTHAAER